MRTSIAKQIISLFLLLFTILTLSAQVSGVAGKQFIVRSNLLPLVQNSGFSLESEWVAFRSRGLQIEFDRYTAERTNSDLGLVDEVWDSAFVSRSTIGFFIKKYKNRALGAPFGFYRKVGVRFGRTTLRTNWERIERINSTQVLIFRNEYMQEQIRSFQYSIGHGAQYHFASRFSFDLSFQFDLNAYNLQDFEWEYLDALDRFSSNPITFSSVDLLSDLIIGDWYILNAGITIQASLGISLF